MFKITTKKEDDAVNVKTDKDKTVFVITSPRGISQAVIEREDKEWPMMVELQLRLQGLESFTASNTAATLHAAVASHKEGQRVRLWKDGKEDELLDAKSPFWMDIQRIEGDGLRMKGYFQMTLPKAFFQDNPKAITLNWIDFHR